MPQTRFTVRHRAGAGSPWYWLTVAVYDTIAELQAAAQRLRPSDVPGFWDNCAGCFQPHTDNPGSGYLGIMRLSHEQLTVDTIVHESVHAAVAYTWRSLGLKALHLNPYSQRSMNEREEVMAHAVNGIACALLKHLHVDTCR
ncbi:hypothetical protein [Mycobacterium aquaticum]|uniref:Uncharacterized protein n=1 Tax=Mycobacterium aquaticum TaxID=1927124 RepID=A0A1X0A538_9MYCO|nr:hypothetical protein [Mycobacterium aquaticum]ORA25179.1 hypothetical protein BST13_33190 [Mycobacterium aquaticum]